MKRQLLASALALSFTASAGLAEVEKRSIWDLFSYDAFAQRAVQGMIMAARTQADITFEHMTTDPFTAEVAITGLSIWPILPYDKDFECSITIDRLSMAGVPFDEITKLALTADAIGLTVASACLPPDAGPIKAALSGNKIEELAFDRVYINVDYDVPSAGAMVSLEASNQSLFNLDALLKFSYLSLEVPDNGDDPNPIMFLTDGRIEIEDLGAWTLASQMMGQDIPPAVLATSMTQQMTQGLQSMNRGEDLNREQQDFVISAGNTLAGFLTNPGRVVLELHPLDDEVFLDAAKFEDPREIFRLVRPEFAGRAKARDEVLSPALLQLAKDPAMLGVSDEDRLRVGRALVSGVGAPRMVAAGAEVLRPLAEAGNGEAALLVAKALQSSDPSGAYQQALLAGAAGEIAALGVLDDIERDLALSEIIGLQAGAEGQLAPIEGITRLSEFRQHALARLNGKGVTRSYRLAYYWARLAAAASDNGANGIIRSIERRAAAMGVNGKDEWATISAQVDQAAFNTWVGAKLGEKIAAGGIN